VVHLLAAHGFDPQPPTRAVADEARVAPAVNTAPVARVARPAIRPDDLPLLDSIRGHGNQTVLARVAADPDGFPGWMMIPAIDAVTSGW
jgi:hypothetical protein